MYAEAHLNHSHINLEAYKEELQCFTGNEETAVCITIEHDICKKNGCSLSFAHTIEIAKITPQIRNRSLLQRKTQTKPRLPAKRRALSSIQKEHDI